MLKRLKLVVKSGVCLLLCFLSVVPVTAQQEKLLSSYTFEEKSEAERIEIIKKIFMELHGLDSIGNIKIISVDEEYGLDTIMPYYTQTKLGEQTKTVTLGAAGNQYPNGVTFANGGSIYWQDGGSNVSVSFAINGQIFSVGISVGLIFSGVTQYAMSCPPAKPCKLGVSKTVKVIRYHLYGDGPNGQWYDQYINYQETLMTNFYNVL